MVRPKTVPAGGLGAVIPEGGEGGIVDIRCDDVNKPLLKHKRLRAADLAKQRAAGCALPCRSVLGRYARYSLRRQTAL